MKTIDSAVLRQVSTLDPAGNYANADQAMVEQTRQWVMAHERSPQQEREPNGDVARPGRRSRLRPAVLIGAAAVVVLGLVGVLPSLSPDGGTPAAAIPLLEHEIDDGHPAGSYLEELAETVRQVPEPKGRYYVEYLHFVGYSMVEEEISPEYWEVTGLELRKEESYFWFDTEDLSGGRTYGPMGEANGGWKYPPGEAIGTHELGEDPQVFFEEFTRFPDSPMAQFPGYYFIDDYTFQAGRMSPAERAVFLRAMALGRDVTYYGHTTARNGQEGVAFGATRVVDGTDIESIMVINPETGAVIETDEIYPNDLPGAPAVVEEYVLVNESGFSDQVPTCGEVACPGAPTG